METSPIAGLFFFLISGTTLISLLNEFGVISYDDWPILAGAAIGLIDLAIEAIVN
ncbi:hypothetical protein HAT86_11605 [Roseovarius gahaiensis]|uniref:Uncharacterized protein n=1 Tax=Roseovarius gahaiensis TaxID=2716691 RepID=A0A967BEK9_9RHOB|nr:hypothetical protein [Roseovarius gahaiensis]NHQ75100.1 hypothetical protein [Roseovarius gahaiensis]